MTIHATNDVFWIPEIYLIHNSMV